MTSRVVFTALFGSTESLVEQPVAAQSKVHFICFTDNPALSSRTWEIVQVTPLFPADPRRSQRDIKIRGHELLDEFDEWLYIDNTVKLKQTPEAIMEEWLVDADWAALSHDANSTLWDEFEANRELNKDTPERLDEQLNDYIAFHRDVLDQHPLWNGIFARRNTAEVTKCARLWFDHVLRYSARDQLSLLVALESHPMRVNRIEARVRNSPWHDWPHREGETVKSKKTRHAKTAGLKPLADELIDAHSRIEELSAEIEQLDQQLTSLKDRQWWGLRGLLRRISEARAKARRKKRQAKKRR
jgi:hypothetical protein